MYTTTVQDVIARIVAFKTFGCKIAVLMILVCRSYYPAINTLDIFATNRPSLVTTCTPIPGVSDHEAILIASDTSAKTYPSVSRKIFLWRRADFDHIKEKIRQFSDDFLSRYTTDHPVNTLWNYFRILCNKCINLIPSKSISTNNNHPWISTFIKRLSRRKQRCYNRARLSHHPEDWQLYYQLKKECQKECQSAYNRYIYDSGNGQITKRLWSFIKSKKKDQCSIPPIHCNDITITDSQGKSNIFNEYFTSIFTQEDLSSVPELNDSPFPEISPISVSVDGVANLLQNLNPHKATGPDGIPAYLLKECSNEIAPILTLIFQCSMQQGSMPDEWKTANIIPIFKKGDRTITDNYRPVSLTSICSKILEHIIYSSIFCHLNEFNILCEGQHGFQTGKSCETQLIMTINDFANCLNENSQIDCILLDFSKAFDRVPHTRLCKKLSYYGIRGPLLLWIKHYLSNRYQRVIIDGTSSDPSVVTSGVSQGTVLAPLLFLCFVNDIPLNVTSKIKLYADDILLYRTISSQADCTLLQKDIDSLVQWSNIWQLPFNFKKCEFLRITNKFSPIITTYQMGAKTINQVT